VRCNLIDNGVQMHLLSRCRLGQILLKPGERLRGEFTVEILK